MGCTRDGRGNWSQPGGVREAFHRAGGVRPSLSEHFGRWPRSVRWCPDRSREMPSRHIVEHLVCTSILVATRFVRGGVRELPMVSEHGLVVAEQAFQQTHGVHGSSCWIGLLGTDPGRGLGLGLWASMLGWTIRFLFFLI